MRLASAAPRTYDPGMKRDLEILRAILLALETQTDSSGLTANRIPGFPTDQVNYNLTLLIEERFVRGNITRTSGQAGGGVAYGQRLEWAGHDLLDAIRSPKVWEETKATIDKVGAFSIGLVKELAMAIAARAVRGQA